MAITRYCIKIYYRKRLCYRLLYLATALIRLIFDFDINFTKKTNTAHKFILGLALIIYLITTQ